MILRVILSCILFAVSLISYSANVLPENSSLTTDSSVAWALNVGGEYYMGKDGIAYQQDTVLQKEWRIDSIRGTQDGTVFESFRLGTNKISKPIDNGFYDIIFKFAEPYEIGVEKRVFNVIAQGQIVISELDITRARDGNAKSSLVRMANNVEGAWRITSREQMVF